jgi:hypothetical protein
MATLEKVEVQICVGATESPHPNQPERLAISPAQPVP